MAEQVLVGGRFSNISQTVLLQAVRELGFDPSSVNSIKRQTLMNKINQIEINNLMEAPCPNGDKHHLRYEQIGAPYDPARSHSDPEYVICNDCGKCYWMKYLD